MTYVLLLLDQILLDSRKNIDRGERRTLLNRRKKVDMFQKKIKVKTEDDGRSRENYTFW